MSIRKRFVKSSHELWEAFKNYESGDDVLTAGDLNATLRVVLTLGCRLIEDHGAQPPNKRFIDDAIRTLTAGVSASDPSPAMVKREDDDSPVPSSRGKRTSDDIYAGSSDREQPPAKKPKLDHGWESCSSEDLAEATRLIEKAMMLAPLSVDQAVDFFAGPMSEPEREFSQLVQDFIEIMARGVVWANDDVWNASLESRKRYLDALTYEEPPYTKIPKSDSVAHFAERLKFLDEMEVKLRQTMFPSRFLTAVEIANIQFFEALDNVQLPEYWDKVSQARLTECYMRLGIPIFLLSELNGDNLDMDAEHDFGLLVAALKYFEQQCDELEIKAPLLLHYNSFKQMTRAFARQCDSEYVLGRLDDFIEQHEHRICFSHLLPSLDSDVEEDSEEEWAGVS